MGDTICDSSCGLDKFFSDEYIRYLGTFIYEQAAEFIKDKKKDSKVTINEDIFHKMFFDLLHDLKRLSCFHEIKRPNLLKIIAYTASWWIRRKPYQIIEDDKDLVFINEQFALSLILFAMQFKNHKNQILKENVQKLTDDVNKVFYHLKYRNTNPQTLELLIIGTELGSMVLE